MKENKESFAKWVALARKEIARRKKQTMSESKGQTSNASSSSAPEVVQTSKIPASTESIWWMFGRQYLKYLTLAGFFLALLGLYFWGFWNVVIVLLTLAIAFLVTLVVLLESRLIALQNQLQSVEQHLSTLTKQAMNGRVS